MSVHRIRTGDDTFRAAIDAMTSAPHRPEFTWRTIPAPSRMAPSTWACTGEILVHDDELASGRLVVLHDPAGQESWDGTSRMVALVQARLEPEFAIESMLGDVAWSWVTESLEPHDADARELGRTATRVVSQSYGALASRPSTVDVEMRVSWTPEPSEDGDLALAPHFAAWTAMLAAAGGRPRRLRRSRRSRPPTMRERPAPRRTTESCGERRERRLPRRSRRSCGVPLPPPHPHARPSPPPPPRDHGQRSQHPDAPRHRHHSCPGTRAARPHRAPRRPRARDRPHPAPAGLVRGGGIRSRRAGRGGRRARLQLPLQLPRLSGAAAHRGGRDRTDRPAGVHDAGHAAHPAGRARVGAHAAGQDLPSLAELGLRPGGLFDTELAARLLGMERVGLGAVVEDTLALRLAKEHSAADWSKRPPPESWLVYAALDVEVLVQVRDVLARRLEEAGKADWAAQEFAHERTREHGPTRSSSWRGRTAWAPCAPCGDSRRRGRCGPAATSSRARRTSPRTG
ncbi:DUF3000 family protein [Brachybacterium sp. GPGPB12]|uniref:DUF3000 family protein n=1 Tax=Brachybacterium sp. GPGPB12 TaxID=3023517 RepID=UPI003134445C